VDAYVLKRLCRSYSLLREAGLTPHLFVLMIQCMAIADAHVSNDFHLWPQIPLVASCPALSFPSQLADQLDFQYCSKSIIVVRVLSLPYK
jgi:hypothetical protein